MTTTQCPTCLARWTGALDEVLRCQHRCPTCCPRSDETDPFIRACANVAAEHERFKALGWTTYPVHSDSMRAIAAAYYATKPEARGFWRSL